MIMFTATVPFAVIYVCVAAIMYDLLAAAFEWIQEFTMTELPLMKIHGPYWPYPVQ